MTLPTKEKTTMTISSKTIYGDAAVQEMPADSDGDVGYRVVTVGGAKVSGVQWTRDAAERDLAALHAHYLVEQASKVAPSRAAKYHAGNERIVGAGPDER